MNKVLNQSCVCALSVVASALMAACQDGPVEEHTFVNPTVTLDLKDHLWSYLSFESGHVVGTSELGDTVADAQWRARKDWDVAFCGERIRTNGGTSGCGQGGLQVVDQPYFEVVEAPLDGYIADRNDIEVW